MLDVALDAALHVGEAAQAEHDDTQRLGARRKSLRRKNLGLAQLHVHRAPPSID
jgi:hypothetical protein